MVGSLRQLRQTGWAFCFFAGKDQRRTNPPPRRSSARRRVPCNPRHHPPRCRFVFSFEKQIGFVFRFKTIGLKKAPTPRGEVMPRITRTGKRPTQFGNRALKVQRRSGCPGAGGIVACTIPGNPSPSTAIAFCIAHDTNALAG